MGVTRFYHPLIRTVNDTVNTCNLPATTNNVLACLPKSNFFYFLCLAVGELSLYRV